MNHALEPHRARWQSANGFRVVATSRPAEDQGGDFYVVAPRKRGDVMLVLCDICGWGQRAAQFAERLLPHTHYLAYAAETPGNLLEALNELALRELPDDMFVATLAVQLDAARGTASIANAGQIPALWRLKSGRTCVVGRASGPPLGTILRPRHAVEQIEFGLGETLVLMTDGVVEAFEQDLVAMPELTELVARSGGDVERIDSAILGEVERQGRAARRDDQTFLGIRLLTTGSQPRLATLRPLAAAG